MPLTSPNILNDRAVSVSNEQSATANPGVQFSPADLPDASRPDAGMTFTNIDDFLAAFGSAGTGPGRELGQGGGDEQDDSDGDGDGALPDTAALGFGDSPPQGGSNPGSGPGAGQPVGGPPPALPVGQGQPPAPPPANSLPQPPATQPSTTQPPPTELPTTELPTTQPPITEGAPGLPNQSGGSGGNGLGQNSSSSSSSSGPATGSNSGAGPSVSKGGGGGGSSGWGGFGTSFGGPHVGAGGGSVPAFNMGGTGTVIAAGILGSVVKKSVFDGDSVMSFDSGDHDQSADHPSDDEMPQAAPPVQGPVQGPVPAPGPHPMTDAESRAAWQSAYAIYNRTATEWNRVLDEQIGVIAEEHTNTIHTERAQSALKAAESRVERAVTKMAAKQNEIAENKTMIARHEETIDDLLHRLGAAHNERAEAEALIESATAAIRDAQHFVDTSPVQSVRDEQAAIIAAQELIKQQQEAEATMQSGRIGSLNARVAIMENLISGESESNVELQASIQSIDSRLNQERAYILNLQDYIRHKTYMTDEVLDARYSDLYGRHEGLKATLAEARAQMDQFHAFRGAATLLVPLNHEPDWQDLTDSVDSDQPADPELPQRPTTSTQTSHPSGTGATHTTTTTPMNLMVVDQQGGADDSDDADDAGDSDMGSHGNVHLAHLQLPVPGNAMPAVPNVATFTALQNTAQEHLAALEAPATGHQANVDGTPHQPLSVVGLPEHAPLG